VRHSAVEPPEQTDALVAVVIPAFRASATIGDVLKRIGPEVVRIYLVDDACPDGTGDLAVRDCVDDRLVVLRNPANLGVGGAMKHGYRRALADGAQIVVKLDADGQMDPSHIPYLIAPLLAGTADYAKGNRFACPTLMPPGSPADSLQEMPLRRRMANLCFSKIHKVATGYSNVVDPANGYTAIHRETLERIEVGQLADCFFFETDMLFSLNLLDASVADVPLPARYAGIGSSLSLRRVAPRFAALTLARCLYRLKRKFRSARQGGGRFHGTARLQPFEQCPDVC